MDLGNVEELPLAPEEYEDDLLEGYRRGLSVEEFAARFAHHFLMFPHYQYSYREPGLTQWVQELAGFFFQADLPTALRLAREKFLEPDEIKRVEEYESSW